MYVCVWVLVGIRLLVCMYDFCKKIRVTPGRCSTSRETIKRFSPIYVWNRWIYSRGHAISSLLECKACTLKIFTCINNGSRVGEVPCIIGEYPHELCIITDKHSVIQKYSSYHIIFLYLHSCIRCRAQSVSKKNKKKLNIVSDNKFVK